MAILVLLTCLLSLQTIFARSTACDSATSALDLLNLKNPNGCHAKGTWFATAQSTNPAFAQRWYSAGHEVAAHTFNHVGDPSEVEITAGRMTLVKYGGIPRGRLGGFRAPYRNFTSDTLDVLSKNSFQYDSSATASKEHDYWPYTLDYGLANECDKIACGDGTTRFPGLWEIPMLPIFDQAGTPHLMDPYLDGNTTTVESWIHINFDRHYNTTRAPFGLHLHLEQLINKNESINMLKSAISYMASYPDVYFVTNQQLLKYMVNPVNTTVLGMQDYMQCPTPSIPREICNGRDDIDTGEIGAKIDQGQLETCNFAAGTWSTCYGCPATQPTVSNPVPPPRSIESSPGYRHAAPDTCDPLYWSPTENMCYCTTDACFFNDTSPPLKVPLTGGSLSSDAYLVRPVMDIKATLTILAIVFTIFAFLF
ncbi:hypothetical protein BGZ94_008663 [Podila epigama]|nr:hypothetical protein BGZ94_008663 [Podila epigama]